MNTSTRTKKRSKSLTSVKTSSDVKKLKDELNSLKEDHNELLNRYDVLKADFDKHQSYMGDRIESLEFAEVETESDISAIFVALKKLGWNEKRRDSPGYAD